MALQTAGIVSGLPYTLIVILLCLSIWRAVQVASGDLNPFGPQFAIGLFDPLCAEPLQVLREKPKEALALFIEFLKNIVLAPWTIANAAHRLGGQKKNNLWIYLLATFPFFMLMIFFLLSELVVSGCWAIGTFFYLLFVASVTGIRLEARSKLKIEGNIFEDFVASLFFYPCVAIQLDMSTRNLTDSKLDKSDNELDIVGETNICTDNADKDISV